MSKKEETKSGGFRILNLAEYERPDIHEHPHKDWVLYGDYNDYFDLIIDRFLGSPTNARCVNGISDMIFGRGLEATDRKINIESYIRMKRIIDERELRRIVGDRKLLGQAAIKVVYNKTKTEIVAIKHFPMETLRAEKTTGGKILAYYYHPKWAEIKPSDKPKRIPTFKNGSKKELEELYIVRPYTSGFYYYSPCDYQACLQYAELEQEVSNYHLSNIDNGLQPSLLINFNNGIPNEETQNDVERKVNEKFGGSSNAGRAIIAFNESAEVAATVDAIHLPDAHAQYQFLADEAREKIMLGHGIVSPILLGIKDNTGFGNNAEELRTASILMDNIVIRPFQQNIIQALDDILAFNKIFLNLYFVTLQPIEFVELDNISTKVTKEQETGEKLSSDECLTLTDDDYDELLETLHGLGEKIDPKEWELIHQIDDESGIELGDANPNKKSIEDKGIYKVRYAYSPVRNSNDSRKFCRDMESFTANDIVFRKEDINQMSFRGRNRELGHNGQNYSLLKYKGGKNCHHRWELRIYKKIGGSEIKDTKGVELPKNPPEMEIRPIDMPNNGGFLKKMLNKIKNK